MRTLAFLIFTMTTFPLSAGELSPEAQQKLARGLGDKVQRFEMWTDKTGNVTGLVLINHQALTKEKGEKPGVNDDDLAALTEFPKLSAITIESQPVTEAGLQVLKQFPDMKQVGFHYMQKARATFASDLKLPEISPDFISVIDGMNDLEILEIKHNFKVDKINIERLEGPFPKVWRLVIDTPVNAKQTMHLIRLCPNVRDLQLHRTSVAPKQVTEIGKRLPKLEVLWFKPKGGLKPEHLTALSTFKNLRIYSPQHFSNAVPYERGWDALTHLPNLQRLEIESKSVAKNQTAIDQLKATRPKLVVSPKLTRSRNYDGL